MTNSNYPHETETVEIDFLFIGEVKENTPDFFQKKNRPPGPGLVSGWVRDCFSTLSDTHCIRMCLCHVYRFENRILGLFAGTIQIDLQTQLIEIAYQSIAFTILFSFKFCF